MKKIYYFYISIFFILLLSSCAKIPKKTVQCSLPKKEKFILKNRGTSLVVTATAYTSRECETDSTPCIAAWNNRLDPKVKSIAVSRDLLKMGLKNGSEIRISGLKGKYKVLDKMNKRWKRRIDIYMGDDLKKALTWGKKKVVISWGTPMIASINSF